LPAPGTQAPASAFRLCSHIYLDHVVGERFKRDVRVGSKANSVFVRRADDSVTAFEKLHDAKRVTGAPGDAASPDANFRELSPIFHRSLRT